VKFVWNEKRLKFEANEEICPTCGERRETVREEGPIKIPWFKAENARNYNNKRVRKYDYDRSVDTDNVVKIPGKRRS
jgi:hypothetical protein